MSYETLSPLPAIPDHLIQAVRGKIRLRKVTPTIVVTDEIEFDYKEIHGTAPAVLMDFVRRGLQKHFNLTPDRIGLVERKGQYTSKVYFALTANLGPRQDDPSVAMACNIPDVPDFIDV